MNGNAGLGIRPLDGAIDQTESSIPVIIVILRSYKNFTFYNNCFLFVSYFMFFLCLFFSAYIHKKKQNAETEIRSTDLLSRIFVLSLRK